MADVLNTSEECDLPSLYAHPFVYKGIILTQYTNNDVMRQCEQFEFRPDDVILASYPRTGTTLTQEIIWQVVNHERVTKDAEFGPLASRFPYLELSSNYNSQPSDEPTALDMLKEQTSRRLIKTHLTYSFLGGQIEKANAKMIVVMRNPKDNVVSCFPFYTGLHIFKEGTSFSDFCRAYMTGKAIYGDFCSMNLQWWALRDRGNVLILRYEDLVRQPFQEVRRVASFLGFTLSSEKIAAIVHNTSFSVMSKNDAVNFRLPSNNGSFLRKGKVGDWKSKLTVAQSEAMDAWMAERLSGTGLQFIFE